MEALKNDVIMQMVRSKRGWGLVVNIADGFGGCVVTEPLERRAFKKGGKKSCRSKVRPSQEFHGLAQGGTGGKSTKRKKARWAPPTLRGVGGRGGSKWVGGWVD